MNFISTFDELNKLYEEVEHEEVIEEACANEELTEAADDEEIEIVDDEAPVEDEVPVEEVPVEEPVADEPRQLILECDKCGALVIKAEADIVADEESGLVNVEDECQFCEETKGYKIVGVMVPYDVAEDEAEMEEPVEQDEIVESSDIESAIGDALNTEALTERLSVDLLDLLGKEQVIGILTSLLKANNLLDKNPKYLVKGKRRYFFHKNMPIDLQTEWIKELIETTARLGNYPVANVVAVFNENLVKTCEPAAAKAALAALGF